MRSIALLPFDHRPVHVEPRTPRPVSGAVWLAIRIGAPLALVPIGLTPASDTPPMLMPLALVPFGLIRARSIEPTGSSVATQPVKTIDASRGNVRCIPHVSAD